tara:strand:- start:5737 stop:5952 length:216 start_codon:yes stop_codon:yes gene_type:complete
MKTFTEALQPITENETYKQILKDSFGGIMYPEGTQKNYDTKELLKLWDELEPVYREASGGITNGVFNFLKN